MAERYVALLRGINVGGKHKLPMKALRALFEEAGCSAVASYIQSGNVVFEASKSVAEKVPRRVGARVEEAFGFRAPIVLRSADALHQAVARNPFLADGGDIQRLHLGFLGTRPAAEAVRSLDPERSPIDRFLVLDDHVYLHVPGGMARTKLTTDYFERRLGTTLTVRNWRTVCKLAEMLGTGSPREAT